MKKKVPKSPSWRIPSGAFSLPRRTELGMRPAMWENPGEGWGVGCTGWLSQGPRPPVSRALILCVPKWNVFYWFFSDHKSNTY